MDELATLRAFVEVVESGSYSAAARKTRTSVSSVGRQIKYLEDSLGVRLLNKTTRAQALTEAGQAFFESTKAVLFELDRSKREVLAYQTIAKGSLRVYARVSAAMEVIIPALPNFLATNPDISLDLVVTDARVDLVSNKIDMAVWLGQLEDSSLVARRLSTSPRAVIGSPAYFRKWGRPEHPTDLANHNCVVNHRDYGSVWRFVKGGDRVDITVAGSLRTSPSSALLTAAQTGIGLTVLPRWMVRASIERGAIIPVLTDYSVMAYDDFDSSLYVVYPQTRGLPLKAKVFADFLVRLFREHDNESEKLT